MPASKKKRNFYMSSMLEEAIVDAKALREAALKNAEAAVVEKYSTEVKSAVTRLLSEQDPLGLDDEEPFGDEALDTDLGLGQPEGEASTTTMEQVPMAHLEDEGIVEVDLDNILAAAAETPEDDFSQDLSDVADNIDISLDDEQSDDLNINEPAGRYAPGNRPDDEIEINEEELVSIFKEMMVVDIPQIELDRAEEALSLDQKEEDEGNLFVDTDGMEEEDIKKLHDVSAENDRLQNENKIITKILQKMKGMLRETNLQNARLLYANRVLTDPSLNEQQKSKVVDMVGKAKSVEEAKMMYETLQKTLAGGSTPVPTQSLSEVVSRASSVILGGSRNEQPTSTDGDPTYNRWATLAGTNK
jgi:hypothetical protein